MSTTVTLKKRIEDLLWHRHLQKANHCTATEITEVLTRDHPNETSKLSSVSMTLNALCDSGHIESVKNGNNRGGFAYRWRA